MSWTGALDGFVTLFTLQDAAQSSPIDISGTNSASSNTTITTTVTTATDKDLMLAAAVHAHNDGLSSYGAGQSDVTGGVYGATTNTTQAISSLPVATAGSASMTTTFGA